MNQSICRRAFTITFLLSSLIALRAFAADPHPSAKWEKDIQAFEAADRKNPPPQGAILFIGSSTFRMWKTMPQDLPGYTTINRGFGGSQMDDATYYVDRIVLPYKPRLIAVHEGANDIHAGKSPEQVLKDFQEFVVKVRAGLPNVKIVFCAIPPAPIRAKEIERIKEANRLIWNYIATQPNVEYIDTFNPYLGPDGQPREDLFIADRLHPNAEGYKIRAAITLPILGKPDMATPGK